jgi:hypothetical protein
MKRIILLLALVALFPFMDGCTSDTSTVSAGSGQTPPLQYPIDPDHARMLRNGRLGGDSGLKLFGGDDDEVSSKGATLGVNSFLWRASLDTLSFVPLSSVDPRGGVIISDWYESQQAKGERFKINVFLLDTRLRSDALRVSVFKQVQGNGAWKDAPVKDDVARELEDKILTRARELKIASAR